MSWVGSIPQRLEAPFFCVLVIWLVFACGGAEHDVQVPESDVPDIEEPGKSATRPEVVEPTSSAGVRPEVVLPPGSERAWLTIYGERPLHLTAEVLRSERQFDRGLMFRTKLDPRAAVLFLFPDAGDHVFWMKNVSIPLDIVFVDSNWNVVAVEHNTVPYSEASLSSAKASKYVVEMNAGLAKDFGVASGAKVKIELDRASCNCKESKGVSGEGASSDAAMKRGDSP